MFVDGLSLTNWMKTRNFLPFRFGRETQILKGLNSRVIRYIATIFYLRLGT